MSLKSGRLIAFEGVDGAGKSTALALVAERLRMRGEAVYVPRSGKHHTSRSVRAIRDLTRDRCHLELDARTELLLYCAREAQVLRELVAPALREGCTVLIDRSLLTPIVLGQARGLARDDCEQAAALAAAGMHPDLTVIFDVHPRTSRIRKRLERIRNHTTDEAGRKSVLGSALKERIRGLYLSTAEAHGHPVLHAERAAPAQLAERVLRLIDHGAHADLGEDEQDRVPQWIVDYHADFTQALDRLSPQLSVYFGDGLLCARAQRRRTCDAEPALCAATLDPADPLREVLAEREPSYALRGFARMPLGGDSDLRIRLLARHPAACIEALKYQRTPRADAVREMHAEQYPDAVLSSLQGREDAWAWRLRERCWRRAGTRARAASLIACGSDAAWTAREALFEQDPVLGLSSLHGVGGARAQHRLERYAELAPKAVLGALGGRSDAGAHALRAQLFATGREVIDSLRGLDDEPSWTLRERALSAWPSTVAHSLIEIEPHERVRAMLQVCRELGGTDLHLHRRLQQLRERALWPDWARAKVGGAAVEDAS